MRIIEELRACSRIEAVRFVTPADRVSIAEVAASAVRMRAEVRSNAASGRCRADLPAVLGDRAQLMQLVEITEQRDPLRLRAGECHPRVGNSGRMSDSPVVADTDRNWARASARVTERFYRIDARAQPRIGRHRLGLAVVKHIVERHKGSLEILSTVGEGTEVVVRLPVVSEMPTLS